MRETAASENTYHVGGSLVKEETGSTREAYKAQAREPLPPRPGRAEPTRERRGDPWRSGAEMRAAGHHRGAGPPLSTVLRPVSLDSWLCDQIVYLIAPDQGEGRRPSPWEGQLGAWKGEVGDGTLPRTPTQSRGQRCVLLPWWKPRVDLGEAQLMFSPLLKASLSQSCSSFYYWSVPCLSFPR